MPKFKILPSPKDKWIYRLYGSDGTVWLNGTKHEIKQACHGEILSVRINAVYLENFEIRTSPSQDYFFILRSMGNQNVIGVSEMYSQRDTCEKIIDQIRKSIEFAEI
ncbi:YegP family protein, partial [Flavobacterium sp.]|uniref:YegP family protein n=1 Tax=Flavobacterium sp. TaxID=239 RepID=UPI002FDAA59D